ncbi:MAG: cupin domain-containing protein [Porticoccaceae bacterium]
MKRIAIVLVSLIFSAPGFSEIKLGTREVLLDNETVEVVRLTYPVGTESGMHIHKHPNRAVYFVKGGKIELIPGDPKQQSNVIDAPDGNTLFLPATTHNVKNIGDTEVILIETEIK